MGVAHKYYQNKNMKDYQRITKWIKAITERIAAPYGSPQEIISTAPQVEYFCAFPYFLPHVWGKCGLITNVTFVFLGRNNLRIH